MDEGATIHDSNNDNKTRRGPEGDPAHYKKLSILGPTVFAPPHPSLIPHPSWSLWVVPFDLPNTPPGSNRSKLISTSSSPSHHPVVC
jgi:hypothetical protein